jgi:colanic acid/amylovoran biosynthesis glycosyltransferase
MRVIVRRRRRRAAEPIRARTRGRIAYVTTRYPYVSHTFIQDEVGALRALGLGIDTFAIRRSDPEQVLSEADRQEWQNTYAIRPPRLTHFALAHLRALAAGPARYAATLRHALHLATPGIRSRIWHLFYFVQAVVLWDRCRRRGIHHVHAHFALVSSDVALLAARLGDGTSALTWSFTMHGPTEFADVTLHRLAEKTLEAQFVVCISSFCRSQLMALVDPQYWDRLHVIHCGVDSDRFTPGLAERADAQTHIVDVARLVPAKGQAVLLQAAARLRDAGLDFTLSFVGDGPELSRLQDLAGQLSLTDRTRFLGALSHDAVRDVLLGADVFCLPSFAEGVPVVLMEAMAMELPVVTSRIMGIPELVQDDVCGVLVAPGAVDELAVALGGLISDPDRRAALGCRARERILEAFDLRRSARSLLVLFTDGARDDDGRP